MVAGRCYSCRLIEVDPDKGQTPTTSDITANKLDLKIEELDASGKLPGLGGCGCRRDQQWRGGGCRLYPDARRDLSGTGGRQRPALREYHRFPQRRRKQQNLSKDCRCLPNERNRKVIEETSKGSSIPAWEDFGRK